MKILSIIPLALLLCTAAAAQTKDCKLKETKDSFTGKRTLATENTRIIVKDNILTSMVGTAQDPWWFGLSFMKDEGDSVRLVARHESNYSSLSPIKALDIKFEDGTVFSFTKPTVLPAKDVVVSMKTGDYQDCLFSLTSAQLQYFSTHVIAKARVTFDYLYDGAPFEKDVKKVKAQEVQKTATCMLSAKK